MKQRILDYITAHPKQTAWEIAQALKLDSGSVSSILFRLKDDGFVGRTHNKETPRRGWEYIAKI